ncbi:Uncharacterized protein APZ42_031892 [Daphnia magna]|uniref:Uncharacterized protein n=1 Tax=Daphnia magna TaxID=35525 RepID=A0A164MCM0_9CRUS|nr:Uncharacterized protein APZ42_031892 [Daphnia magna]
MSYFKMDDWWFVNSQNFYRNNINSNIEKPSKYFFVKLVLCTETQWWIPWKNICKFNLRFLVNSILKVSFLLTAAWQHNLKIDGWWIV